MSAAVIKVQSYSIRFKTIANLRVGQVFDLKKENDSDRVLFKSSTVAHQSQRYYKGNALVLYFDGSFAKDVQYTGFCIYDPEG